MITRRGVIQGLVGLVTAPAVIRVATLMPVKVMPSEPVLQEMSRALRLSEIREILMPGLRAVLNDQLYHPISGGTK